MKREDRKKRGVGRGIEKPLLGDSFVSVSGRSLMRAAAARAKALAPFFAYREITEPTACRLG